MYKRYIVEHANGICIDNILVMETLENAFKNEKNNLNLILHSDQGSQFTSIDFTKYCKQKNIIQSMNKDGCPYDNAVIEIFFKTLKSEFIH